MKVWRNILLALLLAMAVALAAVRVRGGDAYSQLPISGSNYQAYSIPLFALGRCYLKTPISSAVVAAYANLSETCPEQQFIYAEMGWKGGGRFDPHRTHREGLSADFITPVRDKRTGQAAQLPITLFNRWGYDLRLNSSGCYEDLCVDAKAVILHLAALEKAASEQGCAIKQVIFDPHMFGIIRNDAAFRLIQGIPFMRGEAWFPHDSHYHVDFLLLN